MQTRSTDLLNEMRDEARAVVEQGSLGAAVTETRIAFMRYVGQGHEILVPLPNRLLSADDVPGIHASYEREYAKYFDRPVPGSDVEIMSYAVVLTTAVPEIAAAPKVSDFIDAQSIRSQRYAIPRAGSSRPGLYTTGSR